MTYSEGASKGGKPKIDNRPAEYLALPNSEQAGAKDTGLVFFGTEDFSAVSLEALINEGWRVLAVVTKPDTKSGRGQKLNSPKVKATAESAGIKVLQPNKLAGLEEEIKQFGAAAGVLVAYGKIIPQSIIDVFPDGIINVHPSALPKYRGPAPIEAAILHNERETAVSLMRLTAGMDEGPVYVQQIVTLDGSEDRLSLNHKLAEIGAELLIKHLPRILDGSLEAKPQDHSKATYTKLLKKEDGATNWQEPAELIERKVRAYLGFPKLIGDIFTQQVYVTKARVASDEQDGQLVIKCSSGWLEVLTLVAPSGRVMSGADYIRGYKNT